MAVRPYVEYSPTLRGAYIYTSYDAGYVAELKALVPPAARSWDSTEKVWYVGQEYAAEAIRLTRKYWPYLDTTLYSSQRNEGYDHARGTHGNTTTTGAGYARTGQTRNSYQFHFGAGGFGFSPPPPSASPGGPLATLHLLPSAPPELVRAAYKTLAMLYHPDKGGDPTKMQALNGAMDELKKAGKA